MAVNIKVTPRFAIDRAADSMKRRWAGWDHDAPDQVNWDHNRGRHTFGPRVDKERYATISFEGQIRLVAELTGRREETNARGGTIKKWSLEGRMLPVGDPVRQASMAVPAPTGRSTIEYIDDPEIAPPVIDTFLLTNNPIRWEIDADVLTAWIDATASGHSVEGRWSTGSTTKKIAPGDRAFLLRQGVPNRGIFASGTIVSTVFQAEHWDGEGGLANYADVMWDTAIDPSDPLPIETLFAELPDGQWEPQANGSQVSPTVVDRLEQLWADHVALVRAAAPLVPGGPISIGQGRRLDALLRKQIEDLAQERLTKFYEGEGWRVEDFRVGNPFDARAARGSEVLYLEAKGTVTDGQRVIVTRGEVNWAQQHSGDCVLGILSGIAIRSDGSVDPDSGTLHRYTWNPDNDDLDPLDYDYYPPDEAQIE